jgi:hypothetical protein
MGTELVDQYSLLHFAVGIVAYFFKIEFKYWILLNLLFEYLENTETGMNFINNTFNKIWPGSKEFHDSLSNSITDILFALLGWIIAYYIDNLGKKYNWHHA